MQRSSGNYPLNFMVPYLSISFAHFFFFLFFLFCFESEGNRSLHSMDSNTMISLRCHDCIQMIMMKYLVKKLRLIFSERCNIVLRRPCPCLHLLMEVGLFGDVDCHIW